MKSSEEMLQIQYINYMQKDQFFVHKFILNQGCETKLCLRCIYLCGDPLKAWLWLKDKHYRRHANLNPESH